MFLNKRMTNLARNSRTNYFSTELLDENTKKEREQGNLTKFKISENSQNCLKKMGISYLFPIQAETFQLIYDGADVIGKDRTGSGKTLAFALPILEKLRNDGLFDGSQRAPVVLVLVPTRELCVQVASEFARLKNSFNEFRVLPIYGGARTSPQIMQLKNGVEIIVGTPGRLKDLIGQGFVNLGSIRHVILDETDEMLNIGFKEAIEDIFSTLKGDLENKGLRIDLVQFLLFSATIPPFVRKISRNFMKNNVVFVDMLRDEGTKTSKTLDHYCQKAESLNNKFDLILKIVYNYTRCGKSVLVFTETKDQANLLHSILEKSRATGLLHGDIDQSRRERTLTSFRRGEIKCLIATNVAARGLDIPNIDLVVQLCPPKMPEHYIHRCGRSGRAGKKGISLTFFTSHEEIIMGEIEVHADLKFYDYQDSVEEKLIEGQLKIALETPVETPTQAILNNERGSGRFGRSSGDEGRQRYGDNQEQSLETIVNGEKSLLTRKNGFTSYQMTTLDKKANLLQYVLLLTKYVPEEFNNEISKAQLLSGANGFVFDVESEKSVEFETGILKIPSEILKVEKLQVLPLLVGSENFSNSNNQQVRERRYPERRTDGSNGYESSLKDEPRKPRGEPREMKEYEMRSLFVSEVQMGTRKSEIYHFCTFNNIKPELVFEKESDFIPNTHTYIVRYPSEEIALEAFETLINREFKGLLLKISRRTKDGKKIFRQTNEERV